MSILGVYCRTSIRGEALKEGWRASTSVKKQSGPQLINVLKVELIMWATGGLSTGNVRILAASYADRDRSALADEKVGVA